MNKLSLRFNDEKLEEQYQEHQTATVRKPLLIKICCIAIIWNLMDFIQFLVQNKEEYMTSTIILNAYTPLISLEVFFLLITCFCKSRTSRWILLIQNHILAIAYWKESQLYTFEQAKFYTFLIIGTQLVVLLTAEIIEMIYQMFGFSIFYLVIMISEDQPFTYSLVVCGALSVIMFFLMFYNNSQKLRQHFKQHFLEDQWEQIYITLNTDPFMIFDYDQQTYSFNFRTQNKFYDQIRNSQELRSFLRQTTAKRIVEENLEQCLHRILSNDQQKQKVIQQNLELIKNNHQTSATETPSMNQFMNIKYSIFIGVKTIIVFQPEKCKETQRYSRKDNNLLLTESYQCKFKLLMRVAKKFILENKSKLFRSLNFNKFKRYCIFSSLFEQLNINDNQSVFFPTKSIIIKKLLNKINKLYPDKNISVVKNRELNRIISNRTILAAMIIGIIERMYSTDVLISYTEVIKGQVEFIFQGYFNKEYFHFIQEKVRQFSKFTPNIYFDLLKIRLRVINYEKQEQLFLNSNEFQQISKIESQIKQLNKTF